MVSNQVDTKDQWILAISNKTTSGFRDREQKDMGSTKLKLSAPRKFKNFWWLGCGRSMITVVSPSACEPFVEQNFRLEVDYSQLPASKPSASINWFNDRMQNDKTPHTNTVLWLPAAQSVSKEGKYTGNQTSLNIAKILSLSLAVLCAEINEVALCKPFSLGYPCILPCCPIKLFRNSFKI